VDKKMHKIIEALLVLILTLALTVGFGYLLGGELPSFATTEVTNGLTVLIAVSNMISAIVAGIALLLVIRFRHDWLKPKGTDVVLDLRLAMKSWYDVRDSLNYGVYDGLFNGYKLSHYDDTDALSEHYHMLKSTVKNEDVQWLNLALLIEKYSFYYPSENIELIKEIKDIRSDLNVDTIVFFAEMEDLNNIKELPKIKREKNEKFNAFKVTVDSFIGKLVVSS
jgi:hypothetical protein